MPDSIRIIDAVLIVVATALGITLLLLFHAHAEAIETTACGIALGYILGVFYSSRSRRS